MQIKIKAWYDGKYGDRPGIVSWEALDRMDSDGICTLMDILKGKEEGMTPLLYSNLQDKFGKEIYDKDIVASGDNTMLVVFEDGGFCLHNPNNSGADRLSADRASRLIVIGNLHENPDLYNLNTKL